MLEATRAHLELYRTSMEERARTKHPCALALLEYDAAMAVTEFKVSERGQMALPAEARRRWNLDQGGTVEIADLGDSLLIVPVGRGGLKALLRAAIDESGGYARLAKRAAVDEPDLE